MERFVAVRSTSINTWKVLVQARSEAYLMKVREPLRRPDCYP